MNRRVFVPLYALGLVAAIVGLASCNGDKKAVHKSPEPSASHAAAPSEALHHWVQHDELRALMTKLEADRKKTVNTVASGDAATLHVDAHRDYLEASEAAKRLAIAAKSMPDAVAKVAMSDEDREEFKKQAKAMHDEARKFSIIARRRLSTDLDARMEALDATCISCHTRFRDVAGELQPPRA